MEGLKIVPFQGVENGYRLRLGDYRAVYTVLDAELVIEVITIGSRGDVYK